MRPAEEPLVVGKAGRAGEAVKRNGDCRDAEAEGCGDAITPEEEDDEGECGCNQKRRLDEHRRGDGEAEEDSGADSVAASNAEACCAEDGEREHRFEGVMVDASDPRGGYEEG